MAHNNNTHRRILAAPDHNPKTSISMDPTLKKQPKPTPFTSKSTIHNISNQFSHLNANHKILKSGHTSYSLDTHLNPKSWTDSSCSALTKSKSQQGKTEAIIKKVPQRGKEFHKEVDVKRGSVNLSKSQEIEKFKGFDEIKKQSLSVLLKNNGRRKSFCGSKIELTDFFSCSGVKVVSVDMPPFMQVHAVNCARKTHDSLEKFTSKALALTLKKVYSPF